MNTISYTVLIMGALIFCAHLFNALFLKIKIPNVLLLLIIGIVSASLVTLYNFIATLVIVSLITYFFLDFELSATIFMVSVFGVIGEKLKPSSANNSSTIEIEDINEKKWNTPLMKLNCNCFK